MKFIITSIVLIWGFFILANAQGKYSLLDKHTKSLIAKKWQISGTEVQIEKQDSALHEQLKQLDTMSLVAYNDMSKQGYSQIQFDSLRAAIRDGIDEQIAQMKDQAENAVLYFKSNGFILNILHDKVVDSSAKWAVKDKEFTITAPNMPQPGASQKFTYNIVSISADSFIIKSNQAGASEPIKFKAYHGK